MIATCAEFDEWCWARSPACGSRWAPGAPARQARRNHGGRASAPARPTTSSPTRSPACTARLVCWRSRRSLNPQAPSRLGPYRPWRAQSNSSCASSWAAAPSPDSLQPTNRARSSAISRAALLWRSGTSRSIQTSAVYRMPFWPRRKRSAPARSDMNSDMSRLSDAGVSTDADGLSSVPEREDWLLLERRDIRPVAALAPRQDRT